MAFETEDHIRVRAYHLWEANGRPVGRDLEFWEQARRTVSENGLPAAKPLVRSPAAASVGAKTTKRGKRVSKQNAG